MFIYYSIICLLLIFAISGCYNVVSNYYSDDCTKEDELLKFYSEDDLAKNHSICVLTRTI